MRLDPSSLDTNRLQSLQKFREQNPSKFFALDPPPPVDIEAPARSYGPMYERQFFLHLSTLLSCSSLLLSITCMLGVL
jgi:hypothetical protein